MFTMFRAVKFIPLVNALLNESSFYVFTTQTWWTAATQRGKQSIIAYRD